MDRLSGKIVWRFDAGVFSYQTGDPVNPTGLAWQRPKQAAGKLAVKLQGCNKIKNRFSRNIGMEEVVIEINLPNLVT